MITTPRDFPLDNFACGSTDPLTDIEITRVEFATRKIRPTRGVHIRGYQPIGYGRPSVPFESLIEKNTIAEIARFPEVKRIQAQPITIHFSIGTKSYRYTPDLLIELWQVPEKLLHFGFAESTLIECKPHGRLTLDRVRIERCFRAAALACSEPLLLITDLHLLVGVLEAPHDC